MQLGFVLERSCEGVSISFLKETARQALYPIEEIEVAANMRVNYR
jgi:hypothetical protein